MSETQLTHKWRQRQLIRQSGNTLHADRALVHDVLEGDVRACQEFEARYRSLIYSVLHRCQVCCQDQDDIYQELYVRLWAQNLRRLRLWQSKGMNRFSYYLTTMVHNLVCDWYRDNGTGTKLVDSINATRDEMRSAGACSLISEETPGDFDTALIWRERVELVLREIGSMRSRDADLIRRKYLCDQSYQQIADALGISINHVGVALLNARRRLAKRLCQRHPDHFGEYGALSPGRACVAGMPERTGRLHGYDNRYEHENP